MTEITYHYNDTIKVDFDVAEHVYTVREARGKEWSEPRKVNGVTTPIGDHTPKPWLAAWAVKVGAEAATEYVVRNFYGFAGDEIEAAYHIPSSQWEDVVKVFKGAHRTRLRSAGDVGTLVHHWCEKWAKSQIPGSGVSRLALPDHPEVKRACETFLEWIERNHVLIRSAEQRIYSREYDYAGTCDLFAWVNDEFTCLDLKTSGQMSLTMNMQTAAYAKAYEEEFPLGPKVENRMILRLPKDGEAFETMSSRDPEDFPAFVQALNLSRYWKLREARAAAEKKSNRELKKKEKK